jgi:hypothetical protein
MCYNTSHDHVAEHIAGKAEGEIGETEYGKIRMGQSHDETFLQVVHYRDITKVAVLCEQCLV